MSEFLAKTLLGKMPLVSTNKLFKTPLGLIFECCGIARDMPIKIDKIEVSIDFHIYAILEFDLLIGYPLENLFQEKPSHGRLSEEFGKIASATHPENPMAKHYPNHNPFKEVKFISLFISPEISCEREHSSPPSLKLKSRPFGHPNFVLDNGRDSMLILHENFCAMDISKSNLGIKRDPIVEHESFSFVTRQVSCSLLKFPKLISLSSACYHEDHNHVSILVSKLFRRMVVDAYVYQKYCISYGCIVVLTLKLEHYC